MMTAILEVLDFASKALTFLIALAGILAFFFRKWISASIDTFFKHKVETQLASQKHEFDLAIEHERAELNKIAEEHKRTLDRQVQLRTRVSDKRFEAYEAFYQSYGDVLRELHALNTLDQDPPALWDDVRDKYILKAFAILQTARENVDAHSFYIDTNLNVRISALYRDISEYLSNGARDAAVLDGLATEESMISAHMKQEVFDNVGGT